MVAFSTILQQLLNGNLHLMQISCSRQSQVSYSLDKLKINVRNITAHFAVATIHAFCSASSYTYIHLCRTLPFVGLKEGGRRLFILIWSVSAFRCFLTHGHTCTSTNTEFSSALFPVQGLPTNTNKPHISKFTLITGETHHTLPGSSNRLLSICSWCSTVPLLPKSGPWHHFVNILHLPSADFLWNAF